MRHLLFTVVELRRTF